MDKNITLPEPSATQPLNSATTTNTPLTPILSVVDTIREFFKYRPPTLVKKNKGHTLSDKTRPPAEFDRHLAKELQLRHVVYLPTITHDLAKVAEDALQSASLAGSLPHTTENFPTREIRRKVIASAPLNEIVLEKQIEDIYALTTAKFCEVVAETLEFQLPRWSKKSCFKFTRATENTKAIADGFFTLDDEVQVENTSSDPHRADNVNAMIKEFPSLAIWEFKSLSSGNLATMEAILQQAEGKDFIWEGCEHGEMCGLHHKGAPGELLTTGGKMGYDALNHPCTNLQSCDSVAPDSPTAKITNKNRLSARHITQQAWAEAVVNDATFIIINAGIFEIIGIRHRATQTLFLSELIKVDDCTSRFGYGELHTGLFIAAYRDAKDRLMRLKQATPASWLKKYVRSAERSSIAPKEIMNKAQTRDWIILPSLMRSIPQSYYLRDPPIGDDIESSRIRALRVHFDNDIDQYMAKGTLEVDGHRLRMSSGSYAGGIVVKYAVTHEAIDKLRREHDVYRDLRSAGVTGIPQVIGLFNVEGCGDSVCTALVMECAGTPLSLLPERLSMDIFGEFQRMLEDIHAAGFIHGNLNRDNLLIRNNRGEVSLTGFGSARRVLDPLEIQSDKKALDAIWSNRLKRTAEGASIDTPGSPLDHTQVFARTTPPKKRGRVIEIRSPKKLAALM